MDGPKYDKDEIKSTDEVHALHVDTMSVFREHIALSASAGIKNLNAIEPDAWVRSNGPNVTFNLVDPTIREVARRERGGTVNVLPIIGTTNLWVSWYERWHVHARGKFVLLAVSLTLWVGPQLSQQKDQLLRAEWDHHSTAAISSGQPHWQIDHPVGINYGVETSSTILGGLESSAVTRLEEVSDRPIVWQDISAYHLGMRGDWISTDASKRGWKSRWQNDGKELHQWLKLCLGYLVDQAVNYPAKPV